MNRNEIKWLPFNSVFSAEETLKELEQKRSKEVMPLLSDDELAVLEQTILRVYHTKEQVHITYFWHDHLYQKQAIIDGLDLTHHKIYLQDHTSVYFEQVCQIQVA